MQNCENDISMFHCLLLLTDLNMNGTRLRKYNLGILTINIEIYWLLMFLPLEPCAYMWNRLFKFVELVELVLLEVVPLGSD